MGGSRVVVGGMRLRRLRRLRRMDVYTNPRPREDETVADLAVIMDKGQRSYVPVRVPYAYGNVVKTMSWRKWNPGLKAWIIPRDDLSTLRQRLEVAGCEVRWTAHDRPS